MPKLNVQQNNQNVIKAFQVALETSHKNLLDNWYFVGGGSQLGDGIFPINQKGQTSYGNGQTFDRWKLSTGGTVTLTQNGITFNGLLFQKKALDLVVGETYTLSRQTQNGEVVSLTGVVPSTEGWMIGSSAFGVYFRPSTKVCDIQIWGDYSLRAMKLEKGSVSTLANDAPPNYEEELIKCKQYFRRITNSGRGRLFIGVGFSGGVEVPNIFGVGNEMRKTTSLAVTYSGSFAINAGTDIAVTNITKNENNSAFGLSFTASGITPYTLYSILGSAGAYIDISAEL